MKQWTYAEIENKIKDELDLHEESIVSPSELQGYVNEAIDEAEAEIVGIYEDYFLTSSEITAIPATASYRLPSDVYANKIRALTWVGGLGEPLPIKRVRDLSFTVSRTRSGKPEMYMLLNPTPVATGPVGSLMTLFPTPNSAGIIRIWHLRHAQRLEADDHVCDIPEFTNFVIAYALAKCAIKEGHPNIGVYAQALEKQRTLMVSTLSDMVPDEDTTIAGDLSHYWDHT